MRIHADPDPQLCTQRQATGQDVIVPDPAEVGRGHPDYKSGSKKQILCLKENFEKNFYNFVSFKMTLDPASI
jgi:hypothetical protein